MFYKLKALITVAIVVCSSFFQLQAQESTDTLFQPASNPSVEEDHRYFYFDPLIIFLGTFRAGYEYKAPQGNKGFLIYPEIRYSKLFGHQVKGGGAEFQYRFYLESDDPEETTNLEGYIAPFARYKYRQVTGQTTQYTTQSTRTVTYKNRYSNFDGGLTFGIKTSFAHYFLLDLYFGGGFRYSMASGDQPKTGIFTAGYTGVIPKLGMSIGVDY